MKLQERLIDELKENLSIIAAGYPAATIGDTYEETEEHFQAIACCRLLNSWDQEGFRRYLFWAGLTRRHFLYRTREKDASSDFRRARSRSQGFFCAIAAGDLPLALEIGDLSPSMWTPDGEYEDDFAYHQFLYLAAKGANASAREAPLTQFDRALEGSSSPRLDVCTALQEGAAGPFEKAFRELVEQQSSDAEEEKARFTAVSTHEPLSRIFTEGYALIQIAQQFGIQLPRSPFPLCPVIGRLAPIERRPDDLFAEMQGS